jgi:uncharacterized metal-binding protein YceD (DUF177 family)
MAEFSRLFRISRLDRGPVTVSVSADPAEACALAKRFGIEGVEALEAELTLSRSGRQVRVDGSFNAVVDQVCVVRLEPFQSTVEGEVEEEFQLTQDLRHREVVVDEGTMEPLVGDVIDIGEVVSQNLSLLLDPFPRAPDATLSDLEYDPPEDNSDKPFAALNKIRPAR